MQIYEYKIERIAPEAKELEEHLNDFGREGWELVAVICQPDGAEAWYFKRVRMKAV